MKKSTKNKPRRRHLPVPKHPIYNGFYDEFKINSGIIKGAFDPNNVTSWRDLSTADSCKRVLAELKGSAEDPANQEYYYVPDGSKWELGKLYKIQNQLKEINTEWERIQEKSKKEGRKAMQTMPIDLLKNKMKLQALEDITTEEIETLENRIKTLEAQAKTTTEPVINFNHPEVIFNKKTGILERLYGQNIKADKNGTLIINDKRSPFDGLEVWKFRAYVVEARRMERQFQERKELKTAKKENRPKRRIRKPKLPIYQDGIITYPGFENPKVLALVDEQKKRLEPAE